MLATSKLTGFVATAKPDEASTFYGGVLGLELLEDSRFALVYRVSDSVIRVQKVESVVAAGYTALGWEVADIGVAVKHLAARGVRFERYPWLPQDDAGIWRTPDGAGVAWFKDPDGNTLSLTQSRPG